MNDRVGAGLTDIPLDITDLPFDTQSARDKARNSTGSNEVETTLDYIVAHQSSTNWCYLLRFNISTNGNCVYQPIGAKVAYSSADSSTCRTKTDIINH